MNTLQHTQLTQESPSERVSRISDAGPKVEGVRAELRTLLAPLFETDWNRANAIESACDALAGAMADNAWIDGFLCGRDPLRLVLEEAES